MYRGWKIEKWETPLSPVANPVFKSLLQDKEALKINIIGEDDKKLLFIFDSHCPAYKSIDETYKTELWSYLDETDQRFGSTFIVKNSSWLKQYQESNVLIRRVPDLKHYVICSSNNIIEILTDKKPQIIE